MNSRENVVGAATASQRSTHELRSELATTSAQLAEAEVAWERTATDARWEVVEDARRRRDQLIVRLRAAEERAAETLAAQRAASLSEYHRHVADVGRCEELIVAQSEAIADLLVEANGVLVGTIFATTKAAEAAARSAASIARTLTAEELGVGEAGPGSDHDRMTAAGLRMIDRAVRLEAHAVALVKAAVARRLREAGNFELTLPLVDFVAIRR
jgi:hypothetical protein